MTITTCPRPLNHIGISVPDIDRVISWSGEVLGYRVSSGPFDLVASPQGQAQFQDALGDRCTHVRIAHLSNGGGVGIELIQPVAQCPDRVPRISCSISRGHFIYA